jgi:NO-binding membrane sensor protein with MHYT domain
MMVPHEPWLVVLSIAIAVQGSFVGLSLARELDHAEGFRRRLALAGASLTLATGVWSMHFVGMLAANFPSAIDYLVLPTLVSFLICVIVVGAGVYVAHAPGPPAVRIAAGAVAMGLGISSMHYVGMSAVHLAGPTHQETPFVFASVVVSIAASAFALWALDSRPTQIRIALGALALGLAISGMHYTAMAGMRLDPQCFDVARFVGAESSLSRNTLALLTTLVAFGVSGAFLLSLVPDRAAAAAVPSHTIASAPASRPTSAPQSELIASVGSPPVTPPRLATIRVEKDGRWRDIVSDEIFAVRANAHYTYIYDGEQEYFCNLSISAVESRLDPALFLRVHRSHIVAVRRIARVKRAGENGIAELGTPVRCSIPIARAHYRAVKQLVRAEPPPTIHALSQQH